MKIELWQGIVGIIVAIIGTSSASFGFAQFLIKRKDEKEEKDVNTLIKDACDKLREELLEKLKKVSEDRSEEGRERFETHKKSFEIVNKQIEENTKQIDQLTTITKDVLSSMASLNKVVRASAESQKNANYDRLLIVGKRVLNNGKMTVAEKTNLRQLYGSWTELHGEGEPLDPEIQTLYEECIKLPVVPNKD